MDIQISLFLLFISFNAGHSLSCYECVGLTGSCENQAEKTCPTGFSKCMSSTTVTQIGDISEKLKFKDCAADCVSGSMNVGIAKDSFVCCNTDRCNIQDAPDPSNVPNGNKCYYCDGYSCSKILSCTGTEDRCLTATATAEGQTSVVKGCVSKSFCEAGRSIRNVLSVSCCEGNLCNSAKSVTQSFLFLCCSLFSFILLH